MAINDDEGVRRFPMVIKEPTHELIEDIKTTLNLESASRVFNLALEKLADLVDIRKENCTIVGVNANNVICHIMKDKDPNKMAAEDKNEKTNRITNLSLTKAADKSIDAIKSYYRTQSDEKIFRLALDDLAELVEMRRAALRIYGRDSSGNPRYAIRSEILDVAEESGRAVREMIFKHTLSPKSPEGPTN